MTPDRVTRRPSVRFWFFATGVLVVVALVGVFSVIFVRSPAEQSIQEQGKTTYATAVIERGTLTGTTTAQGIMSFADQRPLAAAVSGTFTALPSAGAQIAIGQQLYAIDNVPVTLFRGSLPAWRSFSQEMDAGPDVRQLEENLKALGFFSAEPDNTFTWATENAIKRWQKDSQQPQTGVIELGRIEFATTDLRVAELKVRLGDRAAPASPALIVSSLDKKVAVALKLVNQALAQVGFRVSIELPAGKKTTGTVSVVGPPTETGNEEKKEVTIPVVITLDDPAVAAEIQRASVVVGFPAEVRENVLSVPVEALLALSDKQFGVEVLGPDQSAQKMPVRTGLFAAGRVEISGDALEAGQKVVVPKR